MKSEWIELQWERRVIALVLCLLLIAVDGVGVIDGPKRVIENGVLLLHQSGYGLRKLVLWPYETISFVRTGSARLENLEARLSERLADESELVRLQTENKELRSLVGAGIGTSWSYEPSMVVGSDSERMLIEGGINRKFEPGLSVVIDDLLVGRIVTVSQALSEVRLLGAEESRISARILGKDVVGIVTAKGEQMIMEEVLQADDVRVGDVVISKGDDGVVAGLIIGLVDEVAEIDSSVNKQVKIKGMLEERDPELVFVLMTTSRSNND